MDTTNLLDIIPGHDGTQAYIRILYGKEPERGNVIVTLKYGEAVITMPGLFGVEANLDRAAKIGGAWFVGMQVANILEGLVTANGEHWSATDNNLRLFEQAVSDYLELQDNNPGDMPTAFSDFLDTLE